MEQYKVILVDDEVEVIDVMKKKIRWNDLGFDVVGSATNGVKALELVEKLQPDVVLTDIKMTSTSSSTRITLYCSILILLFSGVRCCSFIIAEDCSLLNE